MGGIGLPRTGKDSMSKNSGVNCINCRIQLKSTAKIDFMLFIKGIIESNAL